MRCNSRPPVEVVFMIYRRRGRFPPEGLTRHRGPGSDVQPLQTAGGSNSSLVGGRGAGERLLLERDTDHMETVDAGEEERGWKDAAATG